MRLKRVRIFGFKTFADRTELNLDGGIVAVVGPNGCGKSNLVDAILWGLGEANARQLRAQSNQDVIFSGSSKRKPIGFAEVSLLFDNEDGSLPIDTPEVSITRKLNRSGDSEYFINRQSCRQRDIFDLLADSGLGRAGYSIVGQKEIDTALSAGADERRAWIDEAAGVQRYRVRKVESLRRLSQANEHLSRVADIIHELEGQREPLREEAEVATRYKSLLGGLREVEVGLLVNEAAAATRDLDDLEKRVQESLRLSKVEAARAESLDKQIREAGAEVSEIEQEMDTVRVSLQAAITTTERAEAAERLSVQRLESLDEQEQTLSQDGDASRARVTEAEVDLERLSAEEAVERQALDELREGYAGIGSEARQLTTTLRQAEDDLRKAREAGVRKAKLDAERAHRKERRSQLARELKGLDAAIPDLETAETEASAAYQAVADEFAAFQEQIKAQEGQIQTIRAEEEKDAQTVRSVLAERASLEGRKRGIEATIDTHEGLTQGSRAVLEAAERGILRGRYTPVGGAVEADKELALAIETALGASANDLIVDDEQDAKSAIAWLKENRAGRATFQPIPLMRPVEPSHEMRRLQNERGIVGRASDLVRCKASHRPVIDSLLGRVLIAEDIDDALRLARTSGWSRMVTLGGEVIHSSGAVTGGQQSRTGYGLVQRKADLGEIDKELGRLAQLVGGHESRSSKRRAAIEKANAEITVLRASLQSKNGEVAEARNFRQTILDELKTARKEHDRLLHEQTSLEKADQTPEEEAPDLAAAEARRDAAMKAVAAKTADADQAETRLREAESRLEQARGRREAGSRRLAHAKEAEQAREKRVSNLGPEREKAQHEIVRARQEAQKSKEARSEADEHLRVLQGRKRERLEENLRLTEEARLARDNASALNDTAHQSEVARTRADSRRAGALQRLMEEYGIGEAEALEQEGLHEIPPDAQVVVNRLRREIRSMGDVNLGAIEAYERVNVRWEELTAQREDILTGIEQVQSSIRELDKLTRERFTTTFAAVQDNFAEMFQKLFGGGEGRMSLSDPNNMLESGVEIEVTLPGKKRQALALLSGGERALCAAAFLFALLKVKPSPLVVLDEVDAPLDGRNVERFAATLKEFTDNTQFIVITHNRTTIDAAPVWVGVSMQEPGVSILLPVRLPEAKAMVEQAAGLTEQPPEPQLSGILAPDPS